MSVLRAATAAEVKADADFEVYYNALPLFPPVRKDMYLVFSVRCTVLCVGVISDQTESLPLSSGLGVVSVAHWTHTMSWDLTRSRP